MSGSVADYSIPGPIYLYRWFASNGALLYIGLSRDPNTRGHQHVREGKEWIGWAHRLDVEPSPYPTWREAVTAEGSAIRSERPIFNRTHNWRVDGTGEDALRGARRRPASLVRRDLLAPLDPLPATRDRWRKVDVMKVRCPDCGADVGAWCVDRKPRKRSGGPGIHGGRRALGRELGLFLPYVSHRRPSRREEPAP